MNYILSEDQYQHLMALAHEKGWEDVAMVLRAATPKPALGEQDTTTVRETPYDEVVAFNHELDRKYPDLKNIDMTAWIREDRER